MDGAALLKGVMKHTVKPPQQSPGSDVDGVPCKYNIILTINVTTI